MDNIPTTVTCGHVSGLTTWGYYLAHRFPTADARTPCLLAGIIFGFSVSEEEIMVFCHLPCLQNPRKNWVHKRVRNNTKSRNVKCRQITSACIRHQRSKWSFTQQISYRTFVCTPLTTSSDGENFPHNFQYILLIVLRQVSCGEIQLSEFARPGL